MRDQRATSKTADSFNGNPIERRYLFQLNHIKTDVNLETDIVQYLWVLMFRIGKSLIVIFES